jgi:hypothetical protein
VAEFKQLFLHLATGKRPLFLVLITCGHNLVALRIEN